MVIFVASIVFAAAMLFFVFHAPFLLIQDVVVEGNEIVDAKSVEAITMEELSSNYFFIIPKTNRLIYPQKEIERKIRLEVGRIETISLNVDKKTLHIKIGERGSYALWCQNDQQCFFMDNSGLIFSQAPLFSSGVYKIFTGIITDESPIGKKFLDSEKLADIKILTDFLGEQGWNTERIEVATLRDIILVPSKGPQIKIDLTKSASSTLKILKTLLASDEFKKSAKNTDSVEYIDVRFGSKVFFKPRGAMLPASPAL